MNKFGMAVDKSRLLNYLFNTICHFPNHFLLIKKTDYKLIRLLDKDH